MLRARKGSGMSVSLLEAALWDHFPPPPTYCSNHCLRQTLLSSPSPRNRLSRTPRPKATGRTGDASATLLSASAPPPKIWSLLLTINQISTPFLSTFPCRVWAALQVSFCEGPALFPLTTGDTPLHPPSHGMPSKDPQANRCRNPARTALQELWGGHWPRTPKQRICSFKHLLNNPFWDKCPGQGT